VEPVDAEGGRPSRGGHVSPARVVLIGPECTGKTWLAGELAGRYGVPWSPEQAREYVDRHGAWLTYADVDPIGRGQKAGEDAAIARAAAAGAALVVLDTDLVSTMVYSRHYYGGCPRWIEEEAPRRLGGLYLLHHVDVEWVPDGRQREQPERREELFERFRATLAGLGAPVAEVLGAWDERRRLAVQAVDRLLAGEPSAGRGAG
jgi:nicotinamide riboside kinase